MTTAAKTFEKAFRKEVARHIHDILHQRYVKDRAAASKAAYRKGVTTEVLVATEITNRVMKKVNARLRAG